jgi:hypothetical protein
MQPSKGLHNQVVKIFFTLMSRCTAKTQYRKFEKNIPRKGIARPQSQFLHSCFCERFILFKFMVFYWIKEDAHNKLHHITIFVLFSVMSVFFARQSHTIMLYSSHIVYFHIARVVYVVILHSVYILTVLIQINILLCCTFIVRGEESTSCIFTVVVV